MPAADNGNLGGPDNVIAAAMADRFAAVMLVGVEIVMVIAIVLLIGLLLVRMLRG